jgi:hypothetical protein
VVFTVVFRVDTECSNHVISSVCVPVLASACAKILVTYLKWFLLSFVIHISVKFDLSMEQNLVFMKPQVLNISRLAWTLTVITVTGNVFTVYTELSIVLLHCT